MQPRRVIKTSRPVYRREASPRLRRSWQPPRLNWRLWGVGLGLVVIIVSWWRSFTIHQITIRGNRTLSQAAITGFVRADLKAHPWWGNLTTISTSGLAGDLVADHYQLRQVSVTRSWPHGLKLVVSERTPSLIWKTGDQAYLLDIDGTIISPINPATTKLPVVVDSTNLPIKVGEKAVSQHFVEFCVGLVGSLSHASGISVTGLTVIDTTTEVTVTTNKGYVVKFDTTRSVEEGLEQLRRVQSTLTSQNRTPTSYIDLRIAGKAYYK